MPLPFGLLFGNYTDLGTRLKHVLIIYAVYVGIVAIAHVTSILIFFGGYHKDFLLQISIEIIIIWLPILFLAFVFSFIKLAFLLKTRTLPTEPVKLRLRPLIVLIVIGTFVYPQNNLFASTSATGLGSVSRMLKNESSNLEYFDADVLIETTVTCNNSIEVEKELVSRLVDAARQMAGPNPTDAYNLAAIRKALYDPGAWNYNRPFSYDLADPFGQIPKNRLRSTYIRTRKGNCVSMPILFLIIADRMGLNVHLAAAPLHLFVRYTDPQGVDHNLETTSGGHEARTEFMRQSMPMSDKAIASGIYMRTLTKRESIAEMATVVLDFLFNQHRYQEAVDVANAILTVNPRDAYTIVKKANAIGGMLQTEFIDKYPNPALIPPNPRPRYQTLARQNGQLFRDAEALGWEPSK